MITVALIVEKDHGDPVAIRFPDNDAARPWEDSTRASDLSGVRPHRQHRDAGMKC
jgi:hypothetical protein